MSVSAKTVEMLAAKVEAILPRRNTRIPLGDPGHAAEHGPAVAAAILAASSERS
jgi:hypothetical protein